MAINIPIITSLEDTGIKNAKAAFNDFKTAVSNAEGGMGKFKAGSKVALDAVKANAATFAVAAAGSIIAFAKTSITAFQDLAISAGKFADATGLAVEDASRYMEAAGDIGVPVDALEGAIGRLNRTIGADPDKVRDLGVDLVYLKDGSLDVNETFLNTIQRIKDIKDPAEKARVAAQLLGKGWQGMAELIEGGADDLAASLKGVSDAKVISPAELERAKEYRAAQDNLKDSFEDLSLVLGEKLVPVLTQIIEDFNDIAGAKAPGGGSWFGHVTDAASLFVNTLTMGPVKAFQQYRGEADDSVEASEEYYDSIRRITREALPPLTTELNNATTAIVNADTAWKNLTDSLDEEVALDQAKTQLEELEAAAKLAFGSGAQADIDAYEQQAADFVTMLSAISGAMDGISSKEILIRYKTQGPAAALELANYLARGAEYGGISQQDALTLAGISGTRANGGPVMGGGTYLVGERGPELFTPTSSGNITPNNAMGGGNTITVNVNGGDPDAVVRAIQKYARQNGAIPLQTTTSARF